MAKLKIPKSLAKCADLYAQTRDARLDLQKDVDVLEADEKALKAYLLDMLPRSDMQGVAGTYARVERKVTQEPTIVDKAKLYKYIKKNDAFDLLYSKLNATAVRQRWEANKKIDGVGTFPVEKLSLHKL